MSTRLTQEESVRSQRGVSRAHFGTMPDGQAVERFTLINANGITLEVLSYGGIIQSIRIPDRRGAMADVALGYDTLEQYLGDKSHFGALVGRYANRIRAGRFSLDGRDYELARNEGKSHLHGGVRGFDRRVWTVEPFEHASDVGLALQYTSPDGEEGYPGTVQVRATYTLTDANALVVDYLAASDAPTPINLTQHSYFNLRGEGNGDILGHEIQLAASRFTPIDADLVPTGELRDVGGTPFDFRAPRLIGSRIGEHDEQLGVAGGYDHNFVLDSGGGELALAARLTDPESGRGLDILTTQPGIQFYSGNFLNGQPVTKHGGRYPFRSGLALETQHFPDSPNHPSFPSTILRPGEEFRSRSEYHFVVR